jgi:hypothetical protein
MLAFTSYFFRGSHLGFFLTCTNKKPLVFQLAMFERFSQLTAIIALDRINIFVCTTEMEIVYYVRRN